MDSQPVNWCEYGRLLSQRPKFTERPEFFGGAYYVQESSSMFLWHILTTHFGNAKDLMALDLCASPGGKSTLISDFLESREGFLVSNEVMTKRQVALIENFTRWGSDHQLISQNTALQFGNLRGIFDFVLIDAPCSGEGMFRKDLEARQLWSPQFVKHCSKLQREIVAQALPCLKTDGVLVYSTCTFSEAENEENVHWFSENLDLESIKIEIPQSWSIVETHYKGVWGYRFYPHKVSGEGLFVACLRKKSTERANFLKPKNQDWKPLSNKQLIPIDLPKEDLYHFGEDITFVPQKGKQFNGHLNTKKIGLEIGTFKGEDFIPSHHLAMSQKIPAHILKFALDKATALDFLRKKEVIFDTQNHKGWALVEYEGVTLGWVKILPNRINNRYPQEYRLLKDSK